MIDLDELERVVDCFPFEGDILALSKGECKDLLSRLRKAEKDAARWDYVINNHCIGGMNMGLYADYNYGMDVVTKDDAIAIVDEAMQCK